MAAIAVSFLVMIVAAAVSSGFRHAVRDGISLSMGDIRLEAIGGDGLETENTVPASLTCGDEILAIPGVESVSACVVSAGIVKNGDTIHGVVFKGVDDGAPEGGLGISIPSRLADIMEVEEGGTLVAYFVGERLKVRKFTVKSVYSSIVDIDDNLVVYANIADMRRLNGWDPEEASAIEITLTPAARSQQMAEAVSHTIGTRLMFSSDEREQALVPVTLRQTYPSLFDWLDLLDNNVLFILALMTVVAGFNMISGLLILLFRNISTIGLLKTLGMTDRGIAGVFLRVASRCVLKGMLIGNAAALALCGIQAATHVAKLNPANYFVSFVPVHIDPLSVILCDLAAYLAIMLLLLAPSLYISRIDPSSTLRVN